MRCGPSSGIPLRAPGDGTFLEISPHRTTPPSAGSTPIPCGRARREPFPVLDRRTGEIQATREQLAEPVGCRLTHLSNTVTELERIGAILRKRDGLTVRYLMNPSVATNLPARARARAKVAAPTLRLVTS